MGVPSPPAPDDADGDCRLGASGASAAQVASGLSSLSITLAKLGSDEKRHMQMVESLAKRMAVREKELLKLHAEHKQKSFSESGYVMVRTLGQGRHGMMKLAKRKTPQANVAIPLHVRNDFVAVRLIQRFAVHRTVQGADEMLSVRETRAVLQKHVQILREMDHPNIQRELETFEDHQQIFIVMELYTGGELLDRHDKPLPEERVAWIMNQVVAAMAHAHGKGIVHQDLRPDNVLYATKDEESRVVVTDWSCCEFISSEPENSRRGLIFSDYSAPELEPLRRTDRSDMWSVGVMAFALLRFALPFGAHGPRPEAGNFSWLAEDGPRPSEECVSFLEAVLRSDPAERLSSQDALLHPWLAAARQRHSASVGAELTVQMSGAISSFRSKGSLYRTAYALAVEHLSGDQLNKLTEAFNLLDKDGDGTIEVPDMVQALQDTVLTQRESASGEDAAILEELAGLLDDQTRISALISLMDTDGNGKINYSEFLAAAADGVLHESVAAAWEAFRHFDLDGDGVICEMELNKLLAAPAVTDALKTTHQASATRLSAANVVDLQRAFAEVGGEPKTAQEVFRCFDANGDRQISFEEFASRIFK